MLAIMDFQRDFNDMVMARLKESGSKRLSKVSPAQAYSMLFDNNKRQVPIGQYKVHHSPELLAQSYWPQYQQAVAEVTGLLESGGDITPYLSKTSSNVDGPDRLLAYWGINHLHPVLEGQRDTKNPNFINQRADHLLYFHVKENEVFFIDLLPHPPKGARREEWIDAHLVRVADRNWPQLHRLFEAGPASDGGLSDDEHKAVFSNGGNAFVTTDRGTVIPAGGLMGGQRHSLESTVHWMILHRKIEALQAHVETHHATIFPRGKGLFRFLSLVEVNANGSHFKVHDRLTNASVTVQVP
ncbi:hypothetical protein [Comamonas testosteroni]|nr:hypothetical protein [Comamonas testosteroni]